MTPEDVRYSILRFMLQDRDGGPSWLLLTPLLGVDSTRDAKGNLVVTYAQAAKAVTVEGQNVVFHLRASVRRVSEHHRGVVVRAPARVGGGARGLGRKPGRRGSATTTRSSRTGTRSTT